MEIELAEQHVYLRGSWMITEDRLIFEWEAYLILS